MEQEYIINIKNKEVTITKKQIDEAKKRYTNIIDSINELKDIIGKMFLDGLFNNELYDKINDVLIETFSEIKNIRETLIYLTYTKNEIFELFDIETEQPTEESIKKGIEALEFILNYKK